MNHIVAFVLFLPLIFCGAASANLAAKTMAIVLTSPTDYQIFQRSSSGVASIAISGTYTGSPTAIEASWNGGAYTTIDASPAGGTFSGTLTNQAAGQGTLTVRFTNDTGTTDSATYVGIGDVFLVIGQSNAEGNGDNNQSYTHATLKPVMYNFGSTAWEELADPTHDVGGSPWPLVATDFMADQGVPVGFICAAVGATGLTSGEWKKGGAQYENAVDLVTASGVTAIKAMLWHQGESDVSAAASQASYQTALSQMVDDLQTDSAPLASAKLVAAQIGDRNTAPRSQVDAIRLAIQNRWNNDSDILAGPVTYDIDLNDGDGVHFGSDGDASLITLADRWWRMLDYHYYGGIQGRAPRFAGATRSGTAVTVTFSGGVSPLVGQTDTTGWRFTDNGSDISILSAAASGVNKVVLTLASEPLGIGLVSFGSNEDAHDTTLMDSGTVPLPPEPFIDQATTGAAGETATLDATYDPAFAFYVDIENSAGTKLGSGPVQSVSRWRYTARFDRAGEIGFDYTANDPQADVISNRVIARAYALLNGTWTEVGAGRVDKLDTVPGNDGRVSMSASGLDLIVELSDRSVRSLEVGTGSGASHSAALTAITAYAPSGWTFTPADEPSNNYFYARFGGETVLGALVQLADKTQTHFYRGTGRELIFTSEFESSGVRAIQANGELAAQTCAITSLRRTVDTHELRTRFYVFGSGTGQARLTLAATNRTAPAGYTLNKALSYIEDNAATTEHGLVDKEELHFKEIGPISNTNADLQAAANMLFDAALHELQRRASLADQETYALTVAGCSRLLRPMQTVRVIYRDVDQGIDVDADLYILEATWEVDSSGVRTSRLVVSTDDRWPDSDESAAAERAVQGKVYQVHPQLGPSSHWENGTLYIGSDQANHIAEFPFVLGNEVVTVQQVLFRYKVTEVLSFTTTIVASSTSSGASSATTSAGGSTHSHTVTITSHTHPVPDHQHIISVTGSGTSEAALISSSGGLGFLEKASAGNVTLSTTLSGGVTSDGGGSSTPTSSDEDEHTHNIEHTHTVTPDISTAYGVFRADAARTYALADLEYRVNGGSWAGLDTGDSVGNDYYELDITADVSDATTFRPDQENNLIEIRRNTGAGAMAIDSSLGRSSPYESVGFDVSPAEHGLSVGETVIVTGTESGVHDGTWTVVEIQNANVFFTNQTGDLTLNNSGSVIVNKSAMILAKLGVRTIIQGIAYT